MECMNWKINLSSWNNFFQRITLELFYFLVLKLICWILFSEIKKACFLKAIQKLRGHGETTYNSNFIFRNEVLSIFFRFDFEWSRPGQFLQISNYAISLSRTFVLFDVLPSVSNKQPWISYLAASSLLASASASNLARITGGSCFWSNGAAFSHYMNLNTWGQQSWSWNYL